MKQILLAAALGLVAMPAIAESKKEREARCEKQGDIVALAAEARLKRTREAKAKEEILASTEEAYHGSVPLLVGFVYTQPRADLKKGGTREAFVEQCSAFDPNQ